MVAGGLCHRFPDASTLRCNVAAALDSPAYLYSGENSSTRRARRRWCSFSFRARERYVNNLNDKINVETLKKSLREVSVGLTCPARSIDLGGMSLVLVVKNNESRDLGPGNCLFYFSWSRPPRVDTVVSWHFPR